MSVVIIRIRNTLIIPGENMWSQLLHDYKSKL